MRGMGEHLAGLGYVTLVPDIYYRHGEWAPFEMGSVFADPGGRERIMRMVRSVTADMAVRDARAYADYLLGLPETTGTAIGTTGYWHGRAPFADRGRPSGRPDRRSGLVHGGNLAAAENPDSPHHRAADFAAAVYIAGATDDASFPDEQRERLERALTDAGVRHTIEVYRAAHGFAVPDNARFDQAASDRHWTTLARFFHESLAH